MNIKEKKQELTQRIKEKLDAIDYRITMIFTTYDEEGLLRDGTTKALFATTFTDPVLDKSTHVYSDPETLEMLYLQTGPTTFVEIDDFFKTEDE